MLGRHLNFRAGCDENLAENTSIPLFSKERIKNPYIMLSYIKNKILSIKFWLLEHGKTIVIVLLVLLISSLSFGLGYLIARDIETRAPIIIEKN